MRENDTIGTDPIVVLAWEIADAMGVCYLTGLAIAQAKEGK